MLIVPTSTMRYPMGLERLYAKELRAYVRKEMEIIKEHVPEMVGAVMKNRIRVDEDEPDEESDWIAVLLALIFADVSRSVFVRDKVEKIFRDVQIFADSQWNRVMESTFGGATALPAGYLEDMRKIKELFLYQNLKLIKSIDDDIREGLYYTLERNVVSSVDVDDVERQIVDYIKKRTEMAEKRAVLIGSDQVGKLYGQINQYYQQKNGIESYVWRTMMDNRVRPEHRAREGKIFRWDNPPPDGHPGYPVRCRCYADPLYDTTKIMQQPIKGRYKVM